MARSTSNPIHSDWGNHWWIAWKKREINSWCRRYEGVCNRHSGFQWHCPTIINAKCFSFRAKFVQWDSSFNVIPKIGDYSSCSTRLFTSIQPSYIATVGDTFWSTNLKSISTSNITPALTLAKPLAYNCSIIPSCNISSNWPTYQFPWSMSGSICSDILLRHWKASPFWRGCLSMHQLFLRHVWHGSSLGWLARSRHM